MPEILIVAATPAEANPVLSRFNFAQSGEGLFEGRISSYGISVLITGAGMVNTAYHLGKFSHKNFDLVVNIGICGAFDRNIKIGEVVNVTVDTLSEMGAENDKEFIKFEDLNLGGTNTYQNKHKVSYRAIDSLKKVRGITVNTVHGDEASIKKATTLFHPQVESMEGAAFFRACETFDNYFQVRAVSNYVEKRDKSKWNISSAINNVNEFVIALIMELNNNSPEI